MSDTPQTQQHFDKRMTLSDLITLAVLAAGGVVTVTTIQNGLEEQSERFTRMLEQQRRTDEAQDRAVQQFRTEIRGDVRDIQQMVQQLLQGQFNEQRNQR